MQAQTATLTIAQAFNLAFEYWQAAKQRRRKERRLGSRRKEECSCERKGGDRVIHTEGKVNPEEKNVVENSDDKILDTSPSSGYNSSMNDSQDADDEDLKNDVGEVLLIDLSSPKEESTSTWNDVTIVDIDSYEESCEEENMDLSFTE